MSAYIDLLRQYAFGTPASAPTNSTGGGQNSGIPADTAYRVAAARDNRIGQSITDPLERDLIDLTASELIAKYGPEQGMSLVQQRAMGANQYQRDRYAPGPNTLYDTVSGIGLGLANSVGGIAALGAGLVNDNAGAWIAEKVGEMNDAVRGSQSGILNVHRRANEVTNALDKADNQALYESERKTDDDFMAGLRRIGRDALDAAGNALADPTVLGDGLAEATGSLLAGGPISKAAKYGGAKLIGQLRGGGILSRVGAVKAARIGEKLAMPGTIGAMEAGGVYQQTVQQVQGMSHGQLLQNSPDYAELIQQGWSPEDARVEIATSAGLLAAATQFPIAAAAGTLVSKFEANPLKVGSLGAGVTNMGKEAVEEGIQSGSGQLMGNLGVRTFADQNQDMLDGVGEQVGLGALYGVGAGGVTQVPGAAINGTVAVGSAAVSVGKAALSPLQKRLEKIQADREASSAVSETALNERADTVLNEAPADLEQIDQAVTEQNLAPDKAELIKQRVATLTSTIAFDPTELDDSDMSPELKAGLGKAKNRFDALRMASKVVKATSIDPLNRLQAAIFVNEQLASVGDKLQADLVAAMDPLDENDTEYLPELRKYDSILYDVLNDPEIQESLSFIRQQTANTKAADLTEDKIATPKAQQQAQAVASLAQTEPEAINPELATATLAHAKKGLFKVTPSQVQALEAAVNLSRTGETYKIQAQALKLANVEFVSREILEDETPDGVREMSAAGHTKGILAAMRAGNTALAAELLQDMADFARHMQNKVDAFNRSFQSGTGSKDNRTTFRARNATLNKWYDSEGVWLDPKSKASLTLAQQAGLDAQALGTMANDLIKQFAGLKVQPVSLVPLNKLLVSEPASMLARKFQKGKLTVPTQTTTSANTNQEPAKVEPQAKPGVKSEGKAYPLAIRWLGARPEAQPTPAPVKAVSRITPEQAGRLTDEGLNSRIQRIMARGPVNTLSAEDQATFEVLDVEMTRREDEAVAMQNQEQQQASAPVADVRTETKAETNSTKKNVAPGQSSGAIAQETATGLGALRTRVSKASDNLKTIRTILKFKNSVTAWGQAQNLDVSAAYVKLGQLRKSAVNELQAAKIALERAEARMGTETEAPKPVLDERKEVAPKSVEQAPAPVEDTRPEVKQVEATETAETKEAGQAAEPKTLAEAYPSLVGSDPKGKVKNRFLEAFKLPEQMRSRLLSMSNPVRQVLAALQSVDALEELTGKPSPRDITNKLAKAYRQYLTQTKAVRERMISRLNQKLSDQNYGQAIGQSLLAGLDRDGQVNEFINLKALNLVEVRDGKLGYNENLLQGAILAGMQWLVQAQDQGRVYDARAVADFIGIPESEVSQTELNWFNAGLWAPAVKEAIANKMIQYWGVTPDLDMPEGYVRGIAEAMAAEVMRGLEATGMIYDTEPVFFNGKKFTHIELTENEQVMEMLAALQAFPTAIDHAVLVEPEETRFIGAPPAKMATRQLHGSPAVLKPQQIEAGTKAQNTPYKLSLPMLQFYRMLKREGLLELFGKGDPKRSGLNKNHALSIKGYNMTLDASIRGIEGMVAEMENYAEKNGVELHEVPAYFQYGFTSVGRLMQLGKTNPQASKLMREVLLPTWSTLDLTNKKGNDYKAFMLALGQHLGEKPHKEPMAVTIRKIEERLTGSVKDASKDLSEAVALMKDWVQAEFDEQPMDLGAKDIALLKKTLGKDLSPGAIHALMDYARYLNAGEAGRKAFTTGLYLEADGVTDGPINSLMNLVSDRFSPFWLDLMNRGGFFLGSVASSMGDFAARVTNSRTFFKNSADLYEITTKHLMDKLNLLGFDMVSYEQASLFNQQLQILMNELLPDVTINEAGELEFGRGIAKNPLTVTVYGSGVRGIANKITKALTDALYEKLSNGKPNKELINLVRTLSTQKIDYDKENSGGYVVLDLASQTNTNTGSGSEFTLTPAMLNNLQENVLFLFARPLQEAIEESMDGATRTAKVVRKATQAQGIFLKYAYKQAVADALAQKSPEEAKQFLSRKELDGILQKLLKQYPLIDTGTQLLFVGGNSRAQVEGAEFGRGLKDDFKSSGYIYGPTNPGVSGIPYLVIATGDGQMILNALTGEQALDGVLPVYDGINMPLDKVVDYSQRINKAVYAGWTHNPVRALSNSFTQFLKGTGADQAQEMSQEMQEELSRVFTFEGILEPEDIAASMVALQQDLEERATKLDAKKAVLAKVNQWNDHMASASAPFVKSDGLELPSNPFEAYKVLNEMLDEELAKRPRTKKQNAVPQGPDSDLKQALESVGRVDSTGTRVITRDELLQVVDALNIPLGHKSLVRASLASLRTKGWTLRVGNPDQLIQHAADNELTVPGNIEEAHGLADFTSKSVFLLSATSETLAHELLHAATLEKVFTHYKGGQQDPRIGESIKRIEALMKQFLKIDPSTIKDKNTLNAFLFAREKLTEFNDAVGNRTLAKASQLNEFMAWVLTNQNLVALAKTQKASPVALIARKALELLKRIWRTGLAPSVGEDMFSNLRFNTLAIIQLDNKVAGNTGELTSIALNHAANPNERVQALNLKLLNRIAPLVRAVKDDLARNPNSRPAQRSVEYLSAVRTATQVYKRFANAGFSMTQQQSSLFKTLVTTFAVDQDLNGNAQARLQEVYRHVVGKLTVEDFMRDRTSNDQADRQQANEKYRLVAGEAGRGKDAMGRTTIVPVFLALALVDDSFRSILAKIEVPKVDKLTDKTADAVLTNLGSEGMDRLAKALVGEKNSPQVLQAIDNLADRFAMSQVEDEAYLAQFTTPIGNAVDKTNNWTVDQMQTLSQGVADWANDKASNTNNKAVKMAAQVTEAAMGLFNEDIAGKLGRGWMSLLSKGKVWKPIHDLANEVIGRTEDNASIYDMIKRIRSFVQQVRQHYREDLPGEIRSQFTRPLQASEWTAMFNGLAKTDLAALLPLGSSKVLDLLKDAGKVTAEVTRLEQAIARMDPDNSALLLFKAKQLATYMNTGQVNDNLLRNAEAIARLLGEPMVTNKATRGTPTKALIDAIDRVTSLYAMQGLSTADRTALAELAANEEAGMSFVLGYLEGQRNDELSKSHTEQGRLNHYKGYVPTETASGASLIVADDVAHARLLARGYERVGKYEGSLSETAVVSKSYYFAPLSGRSRFNQGIVQNVRSTMYGVDPVTGFTMDLHGAGRITGKHAVRRAKKMIHRNGIYKEALLPVFDSRGEVVAYERSLDPAQLMKLEKETDLSRVLGIWRGRQAEEAITGRFNVEVVNNLKEIWDKKEVGRADEFINLLDVDSHKDKVIADAVSLMTPEMRRLIKETFGADGFMVHRSMIDDVIGYRSASVGDFWTGNTRLDPKVIKVAEKAATMVFGKDAYKHLVTAEKLWQNFVSDARTTIVVRSVVVPVANLLSNVYALAARGVPLVDILRGFPRKMNELHTHHQNLQMKVKLEARIRAAGNDLAKLRPLKAKMKALEDSSKSLSIWPLIEAGEFSSVSEATVSREETTLFEGKLTDYLGQLTDKLPDSVKTAGKYALITKDTALFQGLQRAVEYGDFLAKAVLYDDLTKRKAGDPKKALAQISQEFINYDRLPGRVRGHMENMGLLWFWHFKLRSLKVALSTIRNNPLHLLFASLVPAPDFFGSVGMSLTDNIFAVGLEGKLDYSVSPDQAFHAFNLNPYVNLMN